MRQFLVLTKIRLFRGIGKKIKKSKADNFCLTLMELASRRWIRWWRWKCRGLGWYVSRVARSGIACDNYVL